MVAVARRAGVATGSVYRHFPSKGDLFAEAFRRASQREVDVLVELGAPHDAGRASGSPPGCEAFVHRALAEPVRAYALIAEPVDPAVEAERLTFRRAYADLFARALREALPATPQPRAGRRRDRRRAGRGAARAARAQRDADAGRADRRPAVLRPVRRGSPCRAAEPV